MLGHMASFGGISSNCGSVWMPSADWPTQGHLAAKAMPTQSVGDEPLTAAKGMMTRQPRIAMARQPVVAEDRIFGRTSFAVAAHPGWAEGQRPLASPSEGGRSYGNQARWGNANQRGARRGEGVTG